MPIIKIKGEEYSISLTKNSFNRRAVQYTNSLREQFKQIGLTEDDINISEERMAMKKAPASVSWWIDGEHCHFSYSKQGKYVDNLLVVLKVIEYHIDKVFTEEMTPQEFISSFKETKDITEKRSGAREFFGLEQDHINLEVINKKYKDLAKTLHPDMPTGNVEKFKELNEHHKILKRELE